MIVNNIFKYFASIQSFERSTSFPYYFDPFRSVRIAFAFPNIWMILLQKSYRMWSLVSYWLQTETSCFIPDFVVVASFLLLIILGDFSSTSLLLTWAMIVDFLKFIRGQSWCCGFSVISRKLAFGWLIKKESWFV